MLVSNNKDDNQLTDRLRDYLQSTLHLRLYLKPWKGSSDLPLFLARGFEFRQAHIFSVPCIFAFVPEDAPVTPSELAKRQDRIKRGAAKVVIFVFEHMSAYVRARMIEKGIAFIVVENQLYIPDLALDLREYFRTRAPLSSSSLSPAAQAVLFRHLLKIDHKIWTPSGLAKELGYSAMTVGRAFEELSANGLAKVIPDGRSKLLKFNESPEEIFKTAHPMLRSPVKSTHFFQAKRMPKGFQSTTLPVQFPYGGEMALSEQSMLNPPQNRHFAVGPTNWKILQAGDYGIEVIYQDEADYGVDVWRYDPDIVTGENKADLLSLYMQFQNHADERVAGAAVHLMENFQWFRA
jgi:DNA-binding MarR family transcriptional regulator